MATLSIVIPAYNEEDAIADIIDRVLSTRAEVSAATGVIDQVELIVVNDASRDRTAEIVAKYPEVCLMNHKQTASFCPRCRATHRRAGVGW